MSSASAQRSRLAETHEVVRPTWQLAVMWLFLIGPVIGLAVAVVLATWLGVGPSWLDIGLAVALYAFTGHGITIGFHRLFTHSSFRANRGLRATLAVAGSMAVEGPVIHWVADHRRHHAHSDVEGDPHSPWRFGTSTGAVAKGLAFAHMGWFLSDEKTNAERFAPDLIADRDIAKISRLFPLWVAISLVLPTVIGGLVTWSWTGAFTAYLWAGVVRLLILHHSTFAINSICHVAGRRPFRSRDKAGNVAVLAILSMGESWHNLHHADPTCARHGVDRGQLDSSARLIRWFEVAGWATNVRWPDPARLARRRVTAEDAAV
ncbi:MAG TPA: fatty acid desaturase [Frankiaceae bacterium]|nr:fatty acid desaturase [Frankiaceae bacterium]